MKKFLLVMLTFYAVLAVGIYVGAKYYLDPYLKVLLVEKGSEASGAEINIGQVTTQFFPLGVKLTQLSAKKSSNAVQLETSSEEALLNLKLSSLLTAKLGVELELKKPRVNFIQKKDVTSSKGQQQTDEQATESASPQVPIKDLSFTVKIISGEFVYQSELGGISKLEDFNLLFDVPSLKENWQFKLTSNVQALNYKIPVIIDSRLNLQGNSLLVPEAKFIIAGVEGNLQGGGDYRTLKSNWKLLADIPRVELLQVPIDTGCVKLQSGSLKLDVDLETEENLKDILSSGKVTAGRMKTEVSCDIAQSQLKGPAELDVSVEYAYSQKTPKIKSVKALGSLSQMSIQYKNYFSKAAGKDFRFDIQGSQEQPQVFNLTKAIVLIDKYQMQAKGKIGMKAASDLEFLFAKADLAGIESLIPLLSAQPVTGEAEIAGRVVGDLTNTETLNLDITSLTLKNIRAMIDYKSELANAKGPVQINLEGALKTKGTQLLNALLDANVNLNQLELSTTQIKKKASDPLALTLKGRAMQEKFKIEQGQLLIPGGNISLTGEVSNPARPNINLSLVTKNLRLESVLGLLPTFKEYKIIGGLDSTTQLKGAYDFKSGIEKSPLAADIKGTLSATSIVLPKSKEPSKDAKKSNETDGVDTTSKLPAPEPLLPNWQIVKNTTMNLQVRIADFRQDKLNAKGIMTTHTLRAGSLNTTGMIQNVFGGQVTLGKAQLNLLEAQPSISLIGRTKGLEVGAVLDWMSEEWKGLAKGATDSQFDLNIPHISRDDFFQKLLGSGSFDLKNGFLSTLSFDQMANEKLSKIPGLSAKENKVNTKGITATAKGKFTIKDGKINLPDFVALTPERNELKSKGWVAFDKTLDLDSELFLTNAGVSGSILEANKDASGRLYLPVRIKGSVFSPDLDIAAQTVTKLLENTAKLEAKKLQNKLGQDLQNKAKDVGKEAEKALKNLFKRQ